MVLTPTGGSSRESSTMGESLMERRRVQDEGLRVVNCFCLGITPPSMLVIKFIYLRNRQILRSTAKDLMIGLEGGVKVPEE